MRGRLSESGRCTACTFVLSQHFLCASPWRNIPRHSRSVEYGSQRLLLSKQGDAAGRRHARAWRLGMAPGGMPALGAWAWYPAACPRLALGHGTRRHARAWRLGVAPGMPALGAWAWYPAACPRLALGHGTRRLALGRGTRQYALDPLRDLSVAAADCASSPGGTAQRIISVWRIYGPARAGSALRCDYA